MIHRNLLKLLCVAAWAWTGLAPVAAQRDIRTLNEGWRFLQGHSSSAADPTFDDAAWQLVHLPHTWNTDAYRVKTYWQGSAWYRRSVQVPEAWAGRSLFLHLEGASKAVTLYVDGQPVGSHQGGYTAATFDVTPYLRPGGSHTLALCVANDRADIAPISADFTFFGGVYRDVWLTATAPQHFRLTDSGSEGIYLSTPEVSDQRGVISLRGEVSNDAADRRRLAVEVRLFAPGGELLHTARQRLTAEAQGHTPFRIELPAVEHPLLWSPEHPHLYRVESRLIDAKSSQELDRLTHPAAFRWYRFDADSGFYLNGRPYKLRGVCRHQDQKPYGPALTDEMHRRDMQLIKQMGANFIRISHYPQDDAILEMCDRLGLLAWEEIPVIDIVPDTPGYADHCEESLREMIRQHYNHPSIILWGYMNEILLVTQRTYRNEAELAPALERTLALARRLEQVVHEEDPTRVSTMAFHGSDAYNTTGISQIPQTVGWNLYQGWYGGRLEEFEAFLERQHREWPTHPILVSEYGAGSDRRLHTHAPRPFDFSIEYQQRYIEHYIPVLEQTPYLCGGSYWNFIDFSSAKRDESMPRINNKGLVAADRTPKDVYYYLQALWRQDIPVLHLATRDWPVRTLVADADSLSPIPLKLYTNLPEASPSVDGHEVATLHPSGGVASFSLPGAVGRRLVAVKGRWQGREVADAYPLTVLRVPLHTAEEGLETTELAVNVGSHCFYTSAQSGLTWVPDQPYRPGSWGYLGGREHSTQTEILGTEDGPLFQTLRRGIQGYRFDVPAGTYELELLLADPFATSASSAYLLGRDGSSAHSTASFRLYLGDQLLEPCTTPAALTGHFQAQRVKYLVRAEGDGLRLRFEPMQGETFLNGIKLRMLHR